MAYLFLDERVSPPVWRFQYTDYLGVRRTMTGSENKTQTEDLAKRTESIQYEIREGIRPVPKPSDTPRSWDEISKEYIEWGRSAGGRNKFGWAKAHAHQRRNKLAWWKSRLNLAVIQDVQLAKVDAVLTQLKAEGRLTGKTVQGYAEPIAAFMDWCVERNYLEFDPLKNISGFDTAPQKPHRALTQDEISRLLAAAPPNRALWYRVALATGYRQKELRALRVSNLEMFGPALTLPAKETKGRRASRQFITKELADELSAMSEGKAPDAPLLNIPAKASMCAHMERDFGAAKIVRDTSEGYATFHSFRVCYINALVESGANVKTIMEAARHSTATMTMQTYAKPNAALLRDAASAAYERVKIPAKSIQAAHKKVAGAEEAVATEGRETVCSNEPHLVESGSTPSGGISITSCENGTEESKSGLKVTQAGTGQGHKPDHQEKAGTLHALPRTFEKHATSTQGFPSDLQAVMNAWHSLPDALKAGILAMVQGVAGKP